MIILDYLKQDLLNSVEGKVITVEMETKHTKGMLVLEHVFIDNEENLCSYNDELHLDWEVAVIEKTDDTFIITLPEITYTIMIGD